MMSQMKYLASVGIALSLLAPAPRGFAHGSARGQQAQSASRHSSRPTSLGSSKVRTPGGTNLVKLSVLQGSSIGPAREIVATVNSRQVMSRYPTGQYYATNTDLRTMLANGFQIQHSLPGDLGTEASAIAVRPWKADEAHVLSVRVSGAVAKRLDSQADRLIARANREHGKAEITDQSFQHAQQIGGFWKQTAALFTANAQALEKNRVAVALDE